MELFYHICFMISLFFEAFAVISGVYILFTYEKLWINFRNRRERMRCLELDALLFFVIPLTTLGEFGRFIGRVARFCVEGAYYLKDVKYEWIFMYWASGLFISCGIIGLHVMLVKLLKDERIQKALHHVRKT